MIHIHYSRADKPRALVVDDNAVDRLIVEMNMQSLGYETTTAQDGQEALDILTQQTFDAIVTDLEMPRMTGDELARKLRTESRYSAHRNTPILLRSSRETDYLNQVLAQGHITLYVQKPQGITAVFTEDPSRQ